MDVLARKVASRFMEAARPSRRTSPGKFKPRLKERDWVDVTAPDGVGDFSDATVPGEGNFTDVTKVTAVSAPSRSPRAPTKFQPRVKLDDESEDITEVTKEGTEVDAMEDKEAVIRKEKGEYCVRSPNNPNWNGGCYKSKGEAKKRLQQVEFFKRQD